MRSASLLTMAVGMLLACATYPPSTAKAADMSKGLMLALPAPHGHGPKINGSLKGWNMAAADPIWMSTQTARKMNALATLEYTKRALYFGVRVMLPDRKIINTNGPEDPFWYGDEVELRLVADPQVAYPVNPGAANVKANPRVCHLTFWKDTLNGKDYLNITHGVKFNLGHRINPPGSMIKIVEHGQHGYTMTARIPWSALDAPGGVMPFKPGQKMPAIIGVHFGGITYTANALYRKDPGGFAFMDIGSWGQVKFSTTGQLARCYPTLVEYLKRVQTGVSRGVPITVQVPRREHVSINIFGPHGQVIRELMTGAVHKKGPLTLHWDGRNQWGAPVAPGTYKWGAYFSPGIRAKYMGTVGSSGTPPYSTLYGTGGWGGDHGPCVGEAADKTGIYFVWAGAERLPELIKMNYQYRTQWRVGAFSLGGWRPGYAVAANGKRVFVVCGRANPTLMRLSARTGQRMNWSGHGAAVTIVHGKLVPVPAASTPLRVPLQNVESMAQDVFLSARVKSTGLQPECTSLAAGQREVFAPVYSKNQIRVFSAHSGRLLRRLACAGPRGVCLDSQGNLFAVSYVPGKPGKIVEFLHAAGTAQVIVASHLAMPWAVAVNRAGRIFVTDEGASQQVKVFSPKGRLLQSWGARGGRPWAGKYVAANYLRLAGIAADFHGGILTAQTALPKVFSLNSAATGKVIRQWFGGNGYWGQVTPGARHPRTVYYQFEPPGLARARVIGRNKIAAPQAYWQLPNAGFHSVGALSYFYWAQDDVVLADNHRQYFVCDAEPHGIALIHGDQLLPVAHFLALDKQQANNPYHRNVVEIWSDTNGDHHIQPGEVQVLSTVAGKPLPSLAAQDGSMWMAKNGDVYLVTQANSIIEIPAKRFLPNGDIQWDLAKAHYVVPVVLRRAGAQLSTGARLGILGVRVNAKGDLYTCVNATVPYYTQAQTRAMHHGIGHDNVCNAVKFMKFAPDGKLLWMAGRKAAGQPGHGLLHHFWVIAGLVGNRYVAGESEWGQMYFYTHDGFYAGSIMNNPSQAPMPGPYTFGSETGSGFVRYFPAKNQVWAYVEGMAYKVLGFDHGRVKGASRQWGQVRLSQVYRSRWQHGPASRQVHLMLAPLSAPWNQPASWRKVPARMMRRNGKPLARIQLAWNAQYLCARFKVWDARPPVNAAHSARLAFNGGDSVGVDLGPLVKNPPKPVRGQVRILAAMIGGKPQLVAYKPLSRRFHQPVSYFTPAGGHVRFAFAGLVPGGLVREKPWAHGYVMTLAVPRSFLSVPLRAGSRLAMDAEVNFSGYTNEGLQVVSRNYLFSPENGVTTMIDDIPTEARLNPQWWGQAVVK